ncbi:MAG: glycosyltransferase [Dermatophilus congolensis]|nr:glycosyltransferase [Dermatophilus congolensis]
MRIIHVVGLISPKGDYGGPTRVATEDVAALSARGHDVTIAAGTWGYDEIPTEIAGVRAKLFPARAPGRGGSLRGLFAPGLAAWLATQAGRTDVVHVHLGRDFVTMPAALAAKARGIPYVVQTHGMVMPSDKTPVKVLDRVSTLPALRGAAKVFYLTPEERRGLLGLDSRLRIEFLRNGIHADQTPRPVSETPHEVLFLARIQERKRPLDFVEMARRLAGEFPDVRFRMIGPDEGQGAAVRAAIDASGYTDRITWEGPIAPEATRSALEQADVYVLPSVNEPYPMSVLESLAVGVPTVITTTCGLADLVRNGHAGAVVEAGVDTVTDAVRKLLASTEIRAAAATGAHDLARNELDISTVAAALENHYTSVR